MADGVYGLDLVITDRDEDLDELIAVAGASGFAPPADIRADRITADGKTFRYVDSESLASDPAQAPAFAALPGALVAVPGYVDAAVHAGVAFGTPASGYRAATGVFAVAGRVHARRFGQRGALPAARGQRRRRAHRGGGLADPRGRHTRGQPRARADPPAARLARGGLGVGRRLQRRRPRARAHRGRAGVRHRRRRAEGARRARSSRGPTRSRSSAGCRRRATSCRRARPRRSPPMRRRSAISWARAGRSTGARRGRCAPSATCIARPFPTASPARRPARSRRASPTGARSTWASSSTSSTTSSCSGVLGDTSTGCAGRAAAGAPAGSPDAGLPRRPQRHPDLPGRRAHLSRRRPRRRRRHLGRRRRPGRHGRLPRARATPRAAMGNGLRQRARRDARRPALAAGHAAALRAVPAVAVQRFDGAERLCGPLSARCLACAALAVALAPGRVRAGGAQARRERGPEAPARQARRPRDRPAPARRLEAARVLPAARRPEPGARAAARPRRASRCPCPTAGGSCRRWASSSRRTTRTTRTSSRATCPSATTPGSGSGCPDLARRLSPDWFFNLGVISDTLVEARRLPTPVGAQTTARPGAYDVFGQGKQTTVARDARSCRSASSRATRPSSRRTTSSASCPRST